MKRRQKSCLPSKKVLLDTKRKTSNIISKFYKNPLSDTVEFIELRDATTACLVFSNGRRPFEVTSIKIDQWLMAKNGKFIPDEILKRASWRA